MENSIEELEDKLEEILQSGTKAGGREREKIEMKRKLEEQLGRSRNGENRGKKIIR